MNIAEARVCVKLWKERFGLGAWTITFKWGVHESEHGTIEFDILHRTAVISCNRPPKLPKPITVEYVIVHELIHLILVELEIVENAKLAQKELVLERVTNQLTQAFLKGNHTHG